VVPKKDSPFVIDKINALIDAGDDGFIKPFVYENVGFQRMLSLSVLS